MGWLPPISTCATTAAGELSCTKSQRQIAAKHLLPRRCLTGCTASARKAGRGSQYRCCPAQQTQQRLNKLSSLSGPAARLITSLRAMQWTVPAQQAAPAPAI